MTGAINQVTLYYGLTDGGTVASGWDNSLSLGSKIKVPLMLF